MKAESNHKYDTTDYTKIDPFFGDADTMKALCKEAHEKGIRIMVDAVFNHSGRKFEPWIDILEHGKESRYADWFMVEDWEQVQKRGDTRDRRFYSFAFTDGMPKLNTNNEEVIQYFCKICEDWVREFDIDGIRFDVGNEVAHRFLKRIREHLKTIKPDIYLLGRETFLAKVEWEDDWPVVNPGVGMLEKEICLPGEKDNSMPGELNEVRNYSFKNMTDKKLPPDFMMLRNPQPNAYTIDEQEECLKLPAKAVAIGDNGSPSYVAVRQKHHRFQAETEFLLKAGEKGDRAGIAYLQNSQNYLLAEYGEVGADGYIYVTVCINGTEKILAEKKTEKRGMQTLRLSVDQSLAQVWLIRPETEEKSQCIIREVDISHMCTEAAGGFTGCTVGMYVHSEQKQSTGCAQFCRFTVK